MLLPLLASQCISSQLCCDQDDGSCMKLSGSVEIIKNYGFEICEENIDLTVLP